MKEGFRDWSPLSSTPTLTLLPYPSPTQAEREQLMKEGFRDWSRKDLRVLVNALERWGRKDKVCVKDVHKPFSAFRNYDADEPQRRGSGNVRLNPSLPMVLCRSATP